MSEIVSFIEKPAKAVHRLGMVEDHTLVRDGFRSLVESLPDFQFAWWAGSLAEARELLRTDPPTVLTTDISLPDGSGLDLIKEAGAMNPPVPVLVLSMHDETIYARRALKDGAKGYLMKTAAQEDIVDALTKVATGRVYISSQMSETMLQSLRNDGPQHAEPSLRALSDREFEVFQLIGEGLSSLKIGVALRISPKTVDVHKMNIRNKLGLSQGVSLTAYAIRWSEARKLAGG
jgi:DNA-binding NarL/FixJ family response regulator